MTPALAEAVRNTRNAAVRSKLPRLLAIKIVKAAGNQASSEPRCLQLCFWPKRLARLLWKKKHAKSAGKNDDFLTNRTCNMYRNIIQLG